MYFIKGYSINRFSIYSSFSNLIIYLLKLAIDITLDFPLWGPRPGLCLSLENICVSSVVLRGDNYCMRSKGFLHF